MLMAAVVHRKHAHCNGVLCRLLYQYVNCLITSVYSMSVHFWCKFDLWIIFTHTHTHKKHRHCYAVIKWLAGWWCCVNRTWHMHDVRISIKGKICSSSFILLLNLNSREIYALQRQWEAILCRIIRNEYNKYGTTTWKKNHSKNERQTKKKWATAHDGCIFMIFVEKCVLSWVVEISSKMFFFNP